MKTQAIYRARGFSLVEMAIVLVIFGLVIGGMMGPIRLQLEAAKLRDTTRTMDLAKHALLGFTLREGRLPCPDTDNDGTENRNGNNCTSALGILPSGTLGIDNEDAWKQALIYRVDTQLADTNDGSGCPDSDIAGMSIEICSDGNITVRDDVSGNIVATDIPVILVSNGKNGLAGNDANEQENRDNDTNFVDKTHVHNGYDDLVSWISMNELIASLVQAGKLP